MSAIPVNFIPTTSHEDWLAKRRLGVGGSDSAAIMGLSKWSSPLQVYYDKLGQLDPIEENEAMRWGKLLESVVCQEYSNVVGLEVRKPSGIFQSIKHPCMLASLDGCTEDDRVVEIKTSRSSEGWGVPGTDEIPTEYFMQVQHYMAVTGFSVADVAVLIGGSDFRIYEVQADTELQGMMIAQAEKFWQSVVEQQPPKALTQADILQFTKAVTGSSKTTTEEILRNVIDLREIKAKLKELEKEEESLKESIQLYMAEAETLVDSKGNVLATWKTAKAPELFDKERLKEKDPILYGKYTKLGKASRRFNLKQEKSKE